MQTRHAINFLGDLVFENLSNVKFSHKKLNHCKSDNFGEIVDSFKFKYKLQGADKLENLTLRTSPLTIKNTFMSR